MTNLYVVKNKGLGRKQYSYFSKTLPLNKHGQAEENQENLRPFCRCPLRHYSRTRYKSVVIQIIHLLHSFNHWSLLSMLVFWE